VWHALAEKEIAWWVVAVNGNRLEDLGVKGSIILKWILKRYD